MTENTYKIFPVLGIQQEAFQSTSTESQIRYTEIEFSSGVTTLELGIGTNAFKNSSSCALKMYQPLITSLGTRIQNNKIDDATITTLKDGVVDGFLIQGGRIIGTDPENPPQTENEGTELVIDLQELEEGLG